jgi:HSP20 family protein
MTTLTTQKPNGNIAFADVSDLWYEDPFATFDAARRAMFPSEYIKPVPAANLWEKDGTYTLECALPGYRKDDLKVDVHGNTVTLSGSYEFEKKEEGRAYYHRHELRQGSFKRNFVLPGEIDPESITASYHDGILIVKQRLLKTMPTKAIAIKG